MDAMHTECTIDRIQNLEEHRVARLLYDMGLKLVAANSVFEEDHNPIGEIDLIFTSKNTTWIIEVSKNVDSSAQTDKRKRFRRWKEKERWAMVAAKHELPLKNNVRLVYVNLSEKSGDESKTMDVLQVKEVTILYKEHIDRLEKDLKKAKKEIRDAFVDLTKQAKPDAK